MLIPQPGQPVEQGGKKGTVKGVYIGTVASPSLKVEVVWEDGTTSRHSVDDFKTAAWKLP